MLNLDLSKINLILRFFIVGIVYIIIFYALKIMYKDIKTTRTNKNQLRSVGLEVISRGNNNDLEEGAVIPIIGELTIGRKKDNLLILTDSYVSSHHARIFLRDSSYNIEDLGSKNGVYVNNKHLDDVSLLNVGDEIKIGSTVFKVIG